MMGLGPGVGSSDMSRALDQQLMNRTAGTHGLIASNNDDNSPSTDIAWSIEITLFVYYIMICRCISSSDIITLTTELSVG